ncbi:MAG: hypothetical protein RR954_10330, partial [Christensenellaceae bacterium]
EPVWQSARSSSVNCSLDALKGCFDFLLKYNSPFHAKSRLYLYKRLLRNIFLGVIAYRFVALNKTMKLC